MNDTTEVHRPLTRRSWLTGAAATAAAAALGPLAGCEPRAAVDFSGSWIGAQQARGHRLQQLKSGALPLPAAQRRADVLVVGAGVAGLGCARALIAKGIGEVHVLDLEDAAGGNSRGHQIAGIACPLGAHYLPLPGVHSVEVIALLESFGLRRTEHGRAVYDERHLCHSPQERLWVDGAWHDSVLPPLQAMAATERIATLAQYRQFSAAVSALAQRGAGGDAQPRNFTMPTARSRWTAELSALDRVTFAQWLDAQNLTARALRWYLDYCCRDDYGAGAAQVSAWAGVHYFASRHGFRVPGDDAADHTAEREGVLTWPQGNAWLIDRMAAPLRGGAAPRLHTGMTALRVSEGKHTVEVDVWNEAAQHLERWTAPQVVLATPLFIAQRVLATPPAALVECAPALAYAPWLVANLHLDAPLLQQAGAPPSWDNVMYEPDAPDAVGTAARSAVVRSLGYVDAMHQSTAQVAGPTVLTAYVALGGDHAAQSRANRAALLADDWRTRANGILKYLTPMHADLPGKVRQIDLMRYGHAMAVPAPGVRSSAALQALAQTNHSRVRFAHSDMSGYSVFEEALYRGQAAADAACTAVSGKRRG